MTNEIKVGDTVRVSKDAPLHIIGSASEIECAAVVLGTNADIAVIGFRTQEKQRYDAYKVPLKYLVKVGGEKKEPRFKKGDKVRYIGDMQPTYKGKSFVIDGVVFFNDYYNEWQTSSIKPFMWDGLSVCNVPLCDLEPYTEPTEEKINISAPESVESLRIASEESHLRNFSQNIANRDYWDAYTADLAKEIAVKSLEKSCGVDPKRIAEYAVKVAKAVVEELKKK